MTLKYWALFLMSVFYVLLHESDVSLFLFPIVVLLPWFALKRMGLFKGHRDDELDVWMSANPWLWTKLIYIFTIEFFKSNMAVAQLIWNKPQGLSSEWIHVDLPLRSGFAHVLMANFISMTPGTISWKIDNVILGENPGARISVHILDQSQQYSLQALVDSLLPLLAQLTDVKMPKGAR